MQPFIDRLDQSNFDLAHLSFSDLYEKMIANLNKMQNDIQSENNGIDRKIRFIAEEFINRIYAQLDHSFCYTIYRRNANLLLGKRTVEDNKNSRRYLCPDKGNLPDSFLSGKIRFY